MRRGRLPGGRRSRRARCRSEGGTLIISTPAGDHRGNTNPKTDTRAARPRPVRTAPYASLVLWFGCHGPLRRMTAGMSPGLDAVLGVIPSFFAAIYATVAFYIWKRRPLMAAAFGAA